MEPKDKSKDVDQGVTMVIFQDGMDWHARGWGLMMVDHMTGSFKGNWMQSPSNFILSFGEVWAAFAEMRGEYGFS